MLESFDCFEPLLLRRGAFRFLGLSFRDLSTIYRGSTQHASSQASCCLRCFNGRHSCWYSYLLQNLTDFRNQRRSQNGPNMYVSTPRARRVANRNLTCEDNELTWVT